MCSCWQQTRFRLSLSLPSCPFYNYSDFLSLAASYRFMAILIALVRILLFVKKLQILFQSCMLMLSSCTLSSMSCLFFEPLPMSGLDSSLYQFIYKLELASFVFLFCSNTSSLQLSYGRPLQVHFYTQCLYMGRHQTTGMPLFCEQQQINFCSPSIL